MTNGKILPQATEIEASVLGTILSYTNAFHSIQDIFSVNLFYLSQNAFIAQSIINLKDKSSPVDVLTVVQDLKKAGKLKEVGGIPYVSVLQDKANIAALKYNIQILEQESVRRQTIDITSQLTEKAFEPTLDIFDIIDDAEKAMSKLTAKLVTSNIVDSATLAVETDKRNEIIRNSGGVTGVQGGFNDLDKQTGGWQKSDLIILAARPSMGKTSLATQLLMNPALRGKPTAFFSLEMSNEQLYIRMKAQRSGIELYKFLKYGLNEAQKQECDNACKGLYNAPIYFDDTGGITIFELKNKARKLKREKNIELLIIDYLQLINSTRKTGNREQEISQISRELKALAKELEIPVICLSQLSRECEKRSDKKPMLSDLRESGAIEQDADIVFFIYRPEYYGINEIGNESSQGKAVLIIAKNRNGATGDVTLNWNGEKTQFNDINPFENQIALRPNTNFENEPIF